MAKLNVLMTYVEVQEVLETALLSLDSDDDNYDVRDVINAVTDSLDCFVSTERVRQNGIVRAEMIQRLREQHAA
jgi:hypothetical protein